MKFSSKSCSRSGKPSHQSLILIISDHGISLGEKIGERAYGAFCYDYTIKTFGILISTEFKNKVLSRAV